MTLRRINNDTLIDWEKLDNLPNNTNQELVNLNSDITSLQNSKVDKTTTINSKPLNDNINLNKSDIGLSNVENTSDIDKPVSTATQLALNTKADKSNTYTKSEVDILIWDVEVDLSNYYNKTETNTLLDNKVDKVVWKWLSTNDFTNTLKTKLDNITWTNTWDETKSSILSKLEVTKVLEWVTAGTNISIDITDPENPVINSTASWDVEEAPNNWKIYWRKNLGWTEIETFNWLWAYNPATSYVINDAVSYNWSSYICKLASTGNLPTNTTYFDLLAQKGADWVPLATNYTVTNTTTDRTLDGNNTTLDEVIDVLWTVIQDFQLYTNADDTLFIQDNQPTVTRPSLWIDTTWWNITFNLVTP